MDRGGKIDAVSRLCFGFSFRGAYQSASLLETSESTKGETQQDQEDSLE